jgi:hypothetical protein
MGEIQSKYANGNVFKVFKCRFHAGIKLHNGYSTAIDGGNEEN